MRKEVSAVGALKLDRKMQIHALKSKILDKMDLIR